MRLDRFLKGYIIRYIVFDLIMKEFFKKYFKYILAAFVCLGVALCLFFYLTSFNFLARNKSTQCSNLSHTKISNGFGGDFAVSHPWCVVDKWGRLSLYNLLVPNKKALTQSAFIIRSVNLKDYFKGPMYLVMDSETINNEVINQLLWKSGFSSSGSIIKLALPQNNTAVCGDIKINDVNNTVKVFLGSEEIPTRNIGGKYYFCTPVLNLQQLPQLNIVFSHTPNIKSFVMKLYLPPTSEENNIIPVTDFISQHDYFVPFDLAQLTF